MSTIAYLANQFPSTVEPYVIDEIQELRSRGARVIACTVCDGVGATDAALQSLAANTLRLQPLRFGLVIRAVLMCLWRFRDLRDFFWRALVEGNERPGRRLRALAHTGLGVYYALLIEGSGVQHVHVHHGYFASWIAMVAARVLGITFSMTLHGSDLLLHAPFLDKKLRECKFCVTISDFNRRHIVESYPEVEPDKVVVRRLGVNVEKNDFPVTQSSPQSPYLNMLAVGRLHAVKDHAFLIRACRLLKSRGLPFSCSIVGEGPERPRIERLIRDLHLRDEVSLLGHLSSLQLEPCYAAADLVVLTSRSEGIPLVLMEAMARGKPVLAPAITGIPELVRDGVTGFLYPPGSLEDFVERVELAHRSRSALGALCCAARQSVIQDFNREKNLTAFCDFFLGQINDTKNAPTPEINSYAHSLLQ